LQYPENNNGNNNNSNKHNNIYLKSLFRRLKANCGPTTRDFYLPVKGQVTYGRQDVEVMKLKKKKKKKKKGGVGGQ
jgi:hypothetical protein